MILDACVTVPAAIVADPNDKLPGAVDVPVLNEALGAVMIPAVLVILPVVETASEFVETVAKFTPPVPVTIETG